MRVLVALTYYRPHISGLTIYAERLARALTRRGHHVTVLTSQHDPALPRHDTVDEVRIARVPVWARIGKGVVMPGIGWRATRELWRHDAVILHLPQLDAAGIALRARALGKPTVLVYHCDLQLPPGRLNRVAERVVAAANDIAARAAHRVVAYTDDFAASSPLLRRHRHKVATVLPPVPASATASVPRTPPQPPVIGMATRFAAEKGVEVLLDALPAVLSRVPDAAVHFAGQVHDVWGEEALRARLLPRIAALEAAGRWVFRGTLAPDAMAGFYRGLSVLVVPSLNSTESFGLVQVEAMLEGVPVVASNLPGVRQPVRITGLGQIVPVGDAAALAEALVHELSQPRVPDTSPAELARRFSPDENARAFEALLEAC